MITEKRITHTHTHTHRYNFCCDKSFVLTNTCLSQQNMSFVMTKVCLSRQKNGCEKHIFVLTKLLS